MLFRELLSGTLRHKRLLMRNDLPEATLNMKEVTVPDYGDFHLPNYLHLCIEGARSCPFQCSFCSETVQWGNYRKKPAGLLADQMIGLVETHGNKTFFMGDSLMNPYIEDLSKSLLERNADVLYDGYLRADKIATDRARTKKWARSGCVRTRLGIESASAKVLEAMQKETTPAGISKAIKTLAGAGIRVTTLWIVGFPGETEEDFLETLDFIREHHRFIYELDVHYYYYYPYGQVWSRLHKCYPLYPPDVVEYVKFQQWEIENCDPPRQVKFDRLRRINELATELGIPNLHSLNARYRAEARWQLLFPLATEFFKGTLVSRKPYSPKDGLAVPSCVEPPRTKDRAAALSYVVHISKPIAEQTLRQAARTLIDYNEMLRLTLTDGVLAASPLPADLDERVVSVIDVTSVEDRTFIAQTALNISSDMRPRGGDSIRLAVANTPDSAVMIIAADRAIADARSVALFLEDLFRIYEQLSNDKPVTLRQPEIAYCEHLRRSESFDMAVPVSAGRPAGTSTDRLARLRRVVTVETDLVRRFTPKFQQQSGLTFIEFVLGGLVASLAELDSQRPLKLDIRADTRTIHPKLQFTAGPLHATRRVTLDCGNADPALEVAVRARRSLQEALAADAKDSAANITLDLECLTSEPWLGGDEWTPIGFVPAVESAGESGVELIALLDRGRVSFAIDYTEDNLSLVERWCDALQDQTSSVWERLFAEIENKFNRPQKPASSASRFSRKSRFQPGERQRLSMDDLVEFGTLDGSLKPFPLVARSREPELDHIGWVSANRERTDQLLLEHGAVLFRGFDLRTPQHFRQFAATLSDQLIEVSGATSRIELSSSLCARAEHVPDHPIPLHHESASERRWPMKLFLCCQTPGPSGLETPIAHNDRFFEMLDPKVRERFRERGIMYVQDYSAETDRCWQEAFETSDRAAVEDYCRGDGLQYEWIGTDRLRVTRISPAIVPHPCTGKDVWFNQAHLFDNGFRKDERSCRAYYGDGAPIEPAVLNHIRESYQKAAVRFQLQEQDVILVDNMAVAHGSEPFLGGQKTLMIMADWSPENGLSRKALEF